MKENVVGYRLFILTPVKEKYFDFFQVNTNNDFVNYNERIFVIKVMSQNFTSLICFPEIIKHTKLSIEFSTHSHLQFVKSRL